MKRTSVTPAFLVLLLLSMVMPAAFPAERPRLAVLTDIGGDPDDQQALVRLMVYANEFDIEALLASASGTRGELKEAVTRPDLILQVVAGYEKVLLNLQKHASGWPEPAANGSGRMWCPKDRSEPCTPPRTRQRQTNTVA